MRSGSSYIIGLDFDNTLVTYDRLFHQLALEQGLITPDLAISKTAVRDAVRQRPSGEIRWQELQAMAYGPLIRQARVSLGAKAFIRRCRKEGREVHIISHKSPFAARGNGVHLHQAALDWLEQNSFFDPVQRLLDRTQVHFFPTRAQKAAAVKTLQCRVFVDDLADTFLEPDFPANVIRILYGRKSDAPNLPGVLYAEHFSDVESIVFG